MSMMGEVVDRDGAVLTCIAAECTYNRLLECWAPKIAVGDDHPRCDTYTRAPAMDLGDTGSVVGWCGVKTCGFNHGSQCEARGITLDHHGTHADCSTFRP
jgi:hypothetical protein